MGWELQVGLCVPYEMVVPSPRDRSVVMFQVSSFDIVGGHITRLLLQLHEILQAGSSNVEISPPQCSP